jgi:lipoate-protein ligase A
VQGLLLESPPLDVFGQMALDEALAKSAPAEFCLRFFRWRGDGATFGYAQRIAEVERALPPELARACTRRPTGGGVVPHVDDLTFSCVFPAAGVLKPTDLYRRLHAAMLAGLRGTVADARLAESGGRGAPRGPGGASQCFAEPVALDILTAAGKILGGAIRRYGETVLYQGSLQLPGARARAAELEPAIAAALAEEWGVRWARRAAAAEGRAAAELEAKYRSAEWIRRR